MTDDTLTAFLNKALTQKLMLLEGRLESITETLSDLAAQIARASEQIADLRQQLTSTLHQRTNK